MQVAEDQVPHARHDIGARRVRRGDGSRLSASSTSSTVGARSMRRRRARGRERAGTTRAARHTAARVGAVGGERPAAVERNARDQIDERHVEPDRHAVEVDERRLSASANVPPPVATTTCRSGWSSPRISRSTPRKYASPCLREDVGDGQPLAPLDQFVDVLEAPPQARRERPRDRALAAGHEADEIDLVALVIAAQPREVGGEARVRHRRPPRRR